MMMMSQNWISDFADAFVLESKEMLPTDCVKTAMRLASLIFVVTTRARISYRPALSSVIGLSVAGILHPPALFAVRLQCMLY